MKSVMCPNCDVPLVETQYPEGHQEGDASFHCQDSCGVWVLGATFRLYQALSEDHNSRECTEFPLKIDQLSLLLWNTAGNKQMEELLHLALAAAAAEVNG